MLKPGMVSWVIPVKLNFQVFEMNGFKRVILCFMLAITTVLATAREVEILTGKVIRVDDGDTLVLLNEANQKIKLRLSDIDAPEVSHGRSKPGQAFSRRSTKSLASMALGQQAIARCFDVDRYERPVCRIEVSGMDVNSEQVRLGMAWANGANKRYVRNPQTYVLEAEAREARVGLWSAAQPPIPPWEWRRVCWREKGECDEQAD